MDLRSDGKVGDGASRNPKFGQNAIPIFSLNEAWLHTLDSCVVDTPLSEVIFPLMRSCFFGGAMYAVHLLQKGHCNQLASDIAGFITEQPQS
jgi:hypothetical protein